MARSIAELFTKATAVQFLTDGLALAQSFGLLVTSWRTGDPTKVTFQFLAKHLASRDVIIADLAKSAFLSTSEGDWKTIVAHETYGEERTEATPAISQVNLLNTGGGYYDEAARAVVFKSSLSGKTYRNTSAISLHGVGATASVDVVADEEGSGSSAGANEIDELVTSLLGVEIVSSTAAIGVDAQDDAELEIQCLASLGRASNSGPPDAYEFVARDQKLTGVEDVTRATSIGDLTDGTVIVYVAGSAGPVLGSSLIAVQTAIDENVTPLGMLATVNHATAVTVNVTASIHVAPGETLPADPAAMIAQALMDLFSAQPIAKDVGGYDLDPTTITTAIRNAVPEIGSLPAYTPTSAVHLSQGRYPKLGSVSITVV